jgi:hypothetical protein
MDLGFLGDKVTITVGDDLLPHHRLKNDKPKTIDEVLDFGPASLEVEERARKDVEEKFKRRAITFTQGIDLFKDFRYVDIDKIERSNSGWDYFDKPTDFQLLDLVSSIESIGILTPLIVKTRDNERFIIISGNSRFSALKTIYKYKKEDIYKNIPCFVIEGEVDEYFGVTSC